VPKSYFGFILTLGFTPSNPPFFKAGVFYSQLENEEYGGGECGECGKMGRFLLII
jgi:hypothetical protein